MSRTRIWAIAALVAALALYSGEYGSQQLRAKPACEAIGYHAWHVTPLLEIECAVWVDGRPVYFQLQAERPGEVDG